MTSHLILAPAAWFHMKRSTRPTFYPPPLETPPPPAALVLQRAIELAERELAEAPLQLLWFRVEVAAYRLRTGHWPRLAPYDYEGGWGL